MHEVLQVRFTNTVLLYHTNVYDQEPANAQQSFSTTRHPAAYRTIPILEFLQETWESMACTPKFVEIAGAIRRGLKNLMKWYRKVDDTDAYFICLGK
jgi:hypothetical protein